MIDKARRWLLDIDREMLLASSRLRAPVLDGAMRAATRAGDAETWICVAAFLILGGAARIGGIIATAAIIATLVTAPLKRLCRRARPQRGIVGFRALADDPDAFSFPSGHSAAAWAVAFALAGEPTSPLAFVIAVSVSISRVYLGAHYPLDVTAGALLGVICGVSIGLF